MELLARKETVPLKADADGVIRVGGTRVTLDTVVAAFNDGATAEAIAEQYPSLALADVYVVIAYYLRRQTEVGRYLRRRSRQAEAVRVANLARVPPQGVRDRLLARRSR